eukprot:3251612-Amphidinium_carterae.1
MDPLPSHFGKSRRLSFNLRYILASPRAVWPYMRDQWHQMNTFCSQLRVSTSPVPQMTLMELYLLFLVLNGGSRFVTQIPDRDKGGWISTQLERFRLALLCWQTITSSERIIGPETKQAPRVKWGLKFGFPGLSLVSLPGLFHAKWRDARNLLCSAPEQLARLDFEQHTHAAEMWRRWSPGLADSQMLVSQTGLATSPLYLQSMSRIRVKTTLPAWHLHAMQARSLRTAIAELPRAHNLIGGVRVLDLIDAFGFVSRTDARAFTGFYGARQRRLKQLIEHNAGALVNCQHVVTNFLDARPVCVNCGDHGYASFKTHWLRNYCPCSFHMKQEECAERISALQSALCHAREAIAAVAAIFRTL